MSRLSGLVYSLAVCERRSRLWHVYCSVVLWLVGGAPPTLVYRMMHIAMDPHLTLDSLLTAARLLEKSQLLKQMNTLTLPQMCIPMATTQSLHAEPIYNEPIPMDIAYHASAGGKMRVDRRCDASTSNQPYCQPLPTRKTSTKHSRAAHNELEKTRRANLRSCLEKLKSLVPPVADAARNTTLALLTRARDHIRNIDDATTEAEMLLNAEKNRNEALRAELDALREDVNNFKPIEIESPRPVSTDSNRVSPIFLEYSPSTKPSSSPRSIIIDPIAEGLLPPLPISFPRPSVYPFLDLSYSASQRQFLPIHLSV